MKFCLTILTLASVLILACCKSTPTISATDFNDAIVDEHTKIVEAIQLYYEDESYDYDVAKKICLTISNQCDTAIVKVNNLPPFVGGEDFKNSALKMFKFYKHVSNNEFLEISKILANEDYDDGDMDLVMDIESKLDERIETMDFELERAQKSFAKKFNFTIQY